MTATGYYWYVQKRKDLLSARSSLNSLSGEVSSLNDSLKKVVDLIDDGVVIGGKGIDEGNLESVDATIDSINNNKAAILTYCNDMIAYCELMMRSLNPITNPPPSKPSSSSSSSSSSLGPHKSGAIYATLERDV